MYKHSYLDFINGRANEYAIWIYQNGESMTFQWKNKYEYCWKYNEKINEEFYLEMDRLFEHYNYTLIQFNEDCYKTNKYLQKYILEIVNNIGVSKICDVQEKRAKRDKVWDEMVRVVSLQEKHKDWNYPKYDGDGKPLGRNDD